MDHSVQIDKEMLDKEILNNELMPVVAVRLFGYSEAMSTGRRTEDTAGPHHIAIALMTAQPNSELALALDPRLNHDRV